jgi:transcriptional regulator with PAS, ATPase and Fis domain
VGSSKNIPVDIRLICATNMPLIEMVRSGEFREDLLYRINTLELRIPPLRERPSDIPLLVEFFLKKYSKKYQKLKLKMNQSILHKLSKYQWPGNIRELQHAVERAVILSEDNTLNLQDFSMDFSNPSPLSKRETLNLAELEKRYILKAISKNKGNITKAAKDLGIARTALYRRLDKYGL